MTECIAIIVDRFRDPEWEPTCCRVWKEQQCRFMGSRHFGTVDVCTLMHVDVLRDDDGNGWVRPADGCPVWPAEGGAE